MIETSGHFEAVGMNKKDFKKIKAKELESLLDALGASRMDVADALGIGESTLRRWVRNRQIPLPEWEKLNSSELKKTLEIRKRFDSTHHVVPESDDLGDVVYSKAPPSEGELTEEYDLESIPTESLVNELESRGWTVTLQKKKP